VSVVVDELVSPELSVAVAVMVCTPTERFDLEKEPPVPMFPLMLEVQDRLEVIFPSSESSAAAVKVTVLPLLKVEPFAGALMETSGFRFVSSVYSMCKKGAADGRPS
jgi:hypothetical protein